MKGWQIFKHSVLLVMRNWLQALKLALVPLVFVIGLFSAVFAVAAPAPGHPGVGVMGLFFLVWVVAVILMLNVVVSWHRFILLEEYPQGWIPTFHGGRTLGYLGRLILLALIGAVALFPLGAIMGLVGGATGTGQGGMSALFALLVIPLYILLALALYRLSVILPSGAIDQPLTLSEAWHKTEGSTGALFVVIILMILTQLALQVAVMPLMMISPILGMLLSFVASAVLSMAGVSVLTTLYGHYVQGRPID